MAWPVSWRVDIRSFSESGIFDLTSMTCIRPAGSFRHKSSPGTEASRGLRLAITSSHRRIDPRSGIRIASAFVFEVSIWLQYPNFFCHRFEGAY